LELASQSKRRVEKSIHQDQLEAAQARETSIAEKWQDFYDRKVDQVSNVFQTRKCRVFCMPYSTRTHACPSALSSHLSGPEYYNAEVWVPSVGATAASRVDRACICKVNGIMTFTEWQRLWQ
jgi:hypothetical protein